MRSQRFFGQSAGKKYPSIHYMLLLYALVESQHASFPDSLVP